MADGAGMVILGVRAVRAWTNLKCSIIGWPEKTEPAHDPHALGAGLHAGESHALVHCIALGAVEAPQEIEMPPRAAEFAVGDRREPDLLLLGYDAFDLAIFNGGERGRRDLARGSPRPRLLERRRTQ